MKHFLILITEIFIMLCMSWDFNSQDVPITSLQIKDFLIQIAWSAKQYKSFLKLTLINS